MLPGNHPIQKTPYVKIYLNALSYRLSQRKQDLLFNKSDIAKIAKGVD